MKHLLFLLILAGSAGQTFAQSANPITSSEKGIYGLIMSNVLKAADQVSEVDYSFKPTPDVRSFGELIGHIADGQYEFCGPAIGDDTKRPSIEKTKSSKAELVQALKEANGYCNNAFAQMTDVKGAEIASFGGFKLAKLALLSFNTAHTDEHYGNIATYMRMKGLTPPSSQPRVVPAAH